MRRPSAAPQTLTLVSTGATSARSSTSSAIISKDIDRSARLRYSRPCRADFSLTRRCPTSQAAGRCGSRVLRLHQTCRDASDDGQEGPDEVRPAVRTTTGQQPARGGLHNGGEARPDALRLRQPSGGQAAREPSGESPAAVASAAAAGGNLSVAAALRARLKASFQAIILCSLVASRTCGESSTGMKPSTGHYLAPCIVIFEVYATYPVVAALLRAAILDVHFLHLSPRAPVCRKHTRAKPRQSPAPSRVRRWLSCPRWTHAAELCPAPTAARQQASICLTTVR